VRKRPARLPTLAQLLAPYRRLESSRAAVAACARQHHHQLLAAWSPAWCTWTPPTTPAPADLAERWTWLWGFVELDATELVAASGLPQGAGLAAWEGLVGLRLVYPDGTIARAAARLLGAGAPLEPPRSPTRRPAPCP